MTIFWKDKIRYILYKLHLRRRRRPKYQTWYDTGIRADGDVQVSI